MKTKKRTVTFLPKEIIRFHFSMEAKNIKTFNKMTQKEREECMQYMDDCIEVVNNFKQEFKEAYL